MKTNLICETVFLLYPGKEEDTSKHTAFFLSENFLKKEVFGKKLLFL